LIHLKGGGKRGLSFDEGATRPDSSSWKGGKMCALKKGTGKKCRGACSEEKRSTETKGQNHSLLFGTGGREWPRPSLCDLTVGERP